MRYRPVCFVLVSLMSAAFSVRAQDAVRSTSADGDQLPEAEPVVVSATRFDIPLDQSPASVSVFQMRCEKCRDWLSSKLERQVS